jgi:hypothetical protein
MKKMQKKLFAALGVGALLSLAAGSASAITVDLRPDGASGVINGALYQTMDGKVSGTGTFGTFLRVEGSGGAEQGYNTDWRPVEFDEKTDQHTQSLLLVSVPLVNIDGTLYRQFLLDANESGSQAQKDISMDKLEIYQAATGSTHGYAADLGTLIYDMDAGVNSTVLIDSTRGQGSGTYDAIVNIPNSLFNQNTPYVVLFCRFGDTIAAASGFEEWSVAPGNGNTPIPVPVPAAAWMGLITLAGLAGVKSARKLAARA